MLPGLALLPAAASALLPPLLPPLPIVLLRDAFLTDADFLVVVRGLPRMIWRRVTLERDVPMPLMKFESREAGLEDVLDVLACSLVHFGEPVIKETEGSKMHLPYGSQTW